MSRVIHFEILSHDPKAMAEFYKKALGWKTRDSGIPGTTYWLVTTGPAKSAGIDGGLMGKDLPQPELNKQAVINTAQVPSLARTTGDIVKAGGKLVFGPHEIPGVGTFAYFTDPEGTMFGVLQPAPRARKKAAKKKTAKRKAPAARRPAGGKTAKRKTAKRKTAKRKTAKLTTAKRKTARRK